MSAATAAERARMDAAVAELRRQYAAAGVKVSANTSGWFVPEEAKQVAAAFAQVGALLEKWATVYYRWALEGRRDDGTAYTVQRFLEYGQHDIAEAVLQVSAEAYDRSLFAAVQAAAASVVTPSAWPSWVKPVLYVGGGLVALLVAVNVARLVRGK